MPQQNLQKMPCQPSRCISWATESDVRLTRDELKPSVCFPHDLSVATFLSPRLSAVEQKIPPQKSKVMLSFSVCCLGERNNSKFFVWLTQLLPPTMPTNKRGYLRVALVFMGENSWNQDGLGTFRVYKQNCPTDLKSFRTGQWAEFTFSWLWVLCTFISSCF